MKKEKYFKVTMTRYYVVPMSEDGTHTRVNGETVEELKEDWFGKERLNRSHATREGSHLGNVDAVEKVELIDRGQLKAEVEGIERF